MDHCLEYLKSKKYVPIDTTKLMNNTSYSKYAKLAIKHPNIVLYFKRNHITNLLFEILNLPRIINYYFINKDNCLWTSINETFDSNLKRCFDGFLNTEVGHLECEVCLKKTEQIINCRNCYYGMCDECTITLVKNEMTNLDEFDIEMTNLDKFSPNIKCPQCRQIIVLNPH